MKYGFEFALLILAICAAAAAQVKPAATRARVLLPPGNLTYSLGYSQTAEFGGDMGDWQTGAVSGSLGYTNTSQRHPFSLQYGGGYSATLSGPSYGSGLFQHLLLSQGVNWRRWTMSLTDNVSVTPQAPTFGFTGIPGIGGPIANPAPVTNPQSVLTVNTQVVDNNASAQISHVLNHAVVLNLSGSNNLFRYPNGDGLDTMSNTESGGLSWRLSARNSLTSDYQYSTFSYSGLNFSFRTQAAVFGQEHTWTRKISTHISAGPQWTNSSDSAAVPTSLGVTVTAGLTYQSGYNSAGLNYLRGISNGAGFYLGAETDTASASYSRSMNRDITLGGFASYMRTAGLGTTGVTTAKYGGMQINRRLGRYLSLFADYSLTAQSLSSTLPANAFAGLFQSASFGIEYSPRQTRLER